MIGGPYNRPIAMNSPSRIASGNDANDKTTVIPADYRPIAFAYRAP